MAAQRLSGAQQSAVERSGQDVCTVAGPGSGKTRVLVERFAWLVEHGAEPERILAITFTEKAAKEIKGRLAERFAGDEEKRQDVERAQVSTIHGFCHGLLKEHALAAGLDPGFEVLDEHQAAVERGRAMEDALDAAALERPEEFVALAEAWAESDFAAALLGIWGKLRMAGGAAEALARPARFDAPAAADVPAQTARAAMEASPPPTTDAARDVFDGLRAWLAEDRADTLGWLQRFKVNLRPFKTNHPMNPGLKQAREEVAAAKRVAVGALCAPLAAQLRTILVDFEQRYAARKRARAAVDFSDLEEMALALLRRRPEVRTLVQRRFEAVLMDEVQDTNPIQWRILDEVRSPGRFFGVGDANQSIYGFRYADPELFAGYERDVAGRGGIIDRLEENYRSRQEILQVVTRIAGGGRLPGVREHELLAKREYPLAGGPFVEVTRVEGECPEAEWLARRLSELHGTLIVHDPPRPAGWGDMAVLARTTATFGEIEQALGRHGIPCVMKRGKNFYDAQEVVDLTNWLRVMENPRDEVALFGLLRSPLHGVSDEEMLRRRAGGQSLAPEGAWARIGRARALRMETPVSVLLGRELDETGYLARLDVGAKANVEKFLHLLRGLEARAPGDFAAWLEEIDGLRAAGQEPNAPLAGTHNAVEVMTVHTAKGLEFPVVALAAMRRGSGGRSPSIAWSARSGLGLRWQVPGEKDPIPDSAYVAAQAEQARREALEEDRLLYVALTRAEERLLLFWGERGDGKWAGIVEAGLEVAWPELVNEPVEAGDIRVMRAEGLPEVLERAAAPERPAEPAALARLAEELEPASKISVTALARFEACPRRYLLGSLLGWPEAGGGEEGDTGTASQFGTELHEALAGGKAAEGEIAELVSRFETSDLGRRARGAPRVEREFDFLAELDGTLLQGRIDLWFDDAAGRVIVDYKSNRRLHAEQRAEYELQLGLYALALQKLDGRRSAEAWLYMARTGEAVRVPLQDGLLDKAKAVLRKQREAERRGEYPMREGAGCRYCTFLSGACPSRATVDGA